MEVIFMTLIVTLLNGAIVFMDSILADQVSLTLYAEQYMVVSGNGTMVEILFEILLGFGVSLIILKFLKKGFECYVMWTDGDPDSEPTNLILRFIQAIVVAICFPTLYSWLADITENLSNDLLAGIGISTNYDWQIWVTGLSSAGIITAIFGLVFVICYFLLHFQFLMRGLEIMILRVGLPLACIGLLDNDKGVFKSYIMKFFQSAITVIIQISLCKLGVGMMMNIGLNKNLFWGIACMALAIKTPRFLSEFMLPIGGVGNRVVNNLYHSVRLVGMAKNMVK